MMSDTNAIVKQATVSLYEMVEAIQPYRAPGQVRLLPFAAPLHKNDYKALFVIGCRLDGDENPQWLLRTHQLTAHGAATTGLDCSDMKDNEFRRALAYMTRKTDLTKAQPLHFAMRADTANDKDFLKDMGFACTSKPLKGPNKLVVHTIREKVPSRCFIQTGLSASQIDALYFG